MSVIIDEVQICNMALGKLGEREIISSLDDEESETARTCKLHYEHIRNTLLESHVWNFAMSRAVLSRNAESPEFQFAYSFQLPANCLRVVELYQSGSDYAIESKNLLVDDDTASIIFISKETNPTKFSALFVDAFATRLAAEMADQLTNSQSRRVALLEEFKQKFTEAKRRDSQESKRGRTSVRGPSHRFKRKPRF